MGTVHICKYSMGDWEKMTLPYSETTSGVKAMDEIQKILRGFRCQSFGYMTDFENGNLIIQFKYKEIPITVDASFKGYAAAWMKENPWTPKKKSTQVEWEKQAQLTKQQENVAGGDDKRNWTTGAMNRAGADVLTDFIPDETTRLGTAIMVWNAMCEKDTRNICKPIPQPEAAKVALDMDNARDVFENWLTADGNYPHLKHKSFGGQYLHEEAAMKWDGFKAGYYALQTPASDARQEPVNAELLDALRAISNMPESGCNKLEIRIATEAIASAEQKQSTAKDGGE